MGLAFTTQGHKQVVLGDRVFRYGPGESMLATVDLPVTAHVTRATTREPYLGLSVAFDAPSLARIVATGELPRVRPGARFEPLVVQRLDEPVLDALTRLLRLLDEPEMIGHVAPLIRQEILVRLLHGPHAAHLAHLVTAGAPRRQVADVVTWLKQHFVEPIAVDDLADRANMSASTFRQHFRAMTSLSPVQFQKRLRLQEARQLMLIQGVSAAGASALVGYESASQFNREYRRLFGAPPQRDVRSTRTA